MTCDMWHVTQDMCHRTYDMWHLLGDEHYLKMSACKAWVGQCFEDISTKDDWLTKLMNDKVVCRTAPASPGLLNSAFI